MEIFNLNYLVANNSKDIDHNLVCFWSFSHFFLIKNRCHLVKWQPLKNSLMPTLVPFLYGIIIKKKKKSYLNLIFIKLILS